MASINYKVAGFAKSKRTDVGALSKTVDSGIYKPDGVNPRFLFNYVIAHGQSLSIGDQALPVHTTETFGDKVNLFNGLTPIGGGFEIVPPDSSFTSLVPYKETGKETHGWAMFNYMQAQGVLSDRWLYAAYGVGGKTIAELTDNPDPTGWGWSKVSRGNKFAKDLTPNEHSLRTPFTTWIHGEADSENDQTAYKTKLRAYHDRLKSEIGQDFPMLLDQTGKVASLTIATTLLEYSLTNNDAHLVLPKWWLNRLYFGDAIRLHLNANGYMLQGEYFGRYASKLLKGESYGVVYPESWSVDSTLKKLTVNFHVPNGGNLVIDETTVPVAPMLGMRSMRMTNPTYAAKNPLSYVKTGNSIEWTFEDVITTDTIIQLGRNATDAANNGGVLLPLINLRDDNNDDSIAVPGVKLWNWCCQREWYPTKAQGALNRFTDNLWLDGNAVASGVAASTIFAGLSTQWLIRGMASCSVTFTASITSGSAVFWCGNTSRTITNGVNTFTGLITTNLRLYLISGASGFTGSVTNIDVRFLS